jgi:mRNA interferase MazF
LFKAIEPKYQVFITNYLAMPSDRYLNSEEGGLTANSVVLLNQIRSIDKQRLTKRLGKLKAKTMEQVNQAISVSLGLIGI